MDLNQLQKELLAITRENKKLRRKYSKHYITKDGRHIIDYGIRAGDASRLGLSGRRRCSLCGQFVRNEKDDPPGHELLARTEALIKNMLL